MPKRKPHTTGRAKKPTTESESSTIYFYYPNESPYGIFCQWYSSRITIPTTSLTFLTTHSTTTTTTTTTPSPSTILSSYAPSLTFTCAEQFYMFCKSLYFSNAQTCRLVLSTSDPAQQKKFGQKVVGYNEWKWTHVKSRVCRVGNWYKFVQNGNEDRGMRGVLLGTGDRELAEAARRDRVWGIGYNAEEAEVNRENWGENRLGRALMCVRERLKVMVQMEVEGNVVAWDWDGQVEGEDDEDEHEYVDKEGDDEGLGGGGIEFVEGQSVEEGLT